MRGVIRGNGGSGNPENPAVDRAATRAKIGNALPELEKSPPAHPGRQTRRGRRLARWLLGILLLLGLLVFWLNGPGLRYLAPRVATHFLEKSGLRGDFKVGGSLTGGLSLSDLEISSDGVLGEIKIDRLEPRYTLRGLTQGKLEGLTADGIHVELRLGLETPPQPEEPPLDLNKLVETIRSARQQAMPIALDLKGITLSATQDGEPQFVLGGSRITHEAGSSTFHLDLGQLTDPTGRVNAAQSSDILWEPEEISIAQLDPLLGIGLRDLKIALPNGGAPSLATDLLVDDAALSVTTGEGFESAKVLLTSGKISLAETAARFGVELPADGTLTALSVDATDILPDPMTASATATLALADVSYSDWKATELNLQGRFTGGTGAATAKIELTRIAGPDLTASDLVIDATATDVTRPATSTGTAKVTLGEVTYTEWSAEELVLDAALDAAAVSATLEGLALGSQVSLQAAGPVARDGGSFLLGVVDGTLKVDSVPLALRGLSSHVGALDPLAPVPASSLDGKFKVAFTENQPASASAEISLTPADPQAATPVKINGTWSPDGPVTAAAAMDGVRLDASYQIETGVYQASAALEDFTTTRVEPWLSVAKVSLPGTGQLSATLKAAGNAKEGTHRGDLQVAQAKWSRPDADPILAAGSVSFDWPQSVTADRLLVQMNEQAITLVGSYADRTIDLKRLLWTDGSADLAEATAKLPVPADLTDWQASLANDPRPIQLDVHSQVLSLGLLKEWVPALDQLDPASTAQLDVAISGSYRAPEIDAKFVARDLRAPAQPKLPPADLKLSLTTRDGRLVLEGEAVAPDFAPAVIQAGLPFRPSEWAGEPELLQQEPIEARVDLPRLDISRFASLVPSVSQLNGILTGNVVVSGKVGEPEIRGAIDLVGGKVRLKDDTFPAIDAITVAVEGALDRVVLKNLSATVSGGTVNGSGSVAIQDGGLGDIDISLRGNHLPLVRNDYLIVRANADLRVQGPWQQAQLSGTASTVDSIFYRDIELLPIGRPFTGPSAASVPKLDTRKEPTASIPAPFADWGLDVTVRTEGPFLVRGNLANGSVTGSMRIGGTLGKPAPDGEFLIRDFEASLPFSTLMVRQGTAVFTPASGFDPILEIRGTAEPRPYRVDVYVYGRASDPQLVLTSNPPLPENEIMTLLATGTTTSGLEDPQAASSRALQLLVEELRRGRFRFGKQLRPVLGLLDRVDFSLAEADPYSSESYSTATLSITDHWYLSAGVGATGDSRAMAVWRLSFR